MGGNQRAAVCKFWGKACDQEFIANSFFNRGCEMCQYCSIVAKDVPIRFSEDKCPSDAARRNFVAMTALDNALRNVGAEGARPMLPQ